MAGGVWSNIFCTRTLSAKDIAYVVEDNNLAYFYVYMCCVAAGLDVDRVCREMDVQALQQNISNVTFCDVASEASKPLLIL